MFPWELPSWALNDHTAFIALGASTGIGRTRPSKVTVGRGLPYSHDAIAGIYCFEGSDSLSLRQLSQLEATEMMRAKTPLIILIAAIIAPVIIIYGKDRESENLRTEIIHLLSRSRVTEARLDGFDHQLSATTGLASGPDSKLLKKHRAKLEKLIKKNPTANNLHLAALIHVAEENWGTAINLLRKAAQADRYNSSVLNDLAVAHIEYAEVAQGPRDLISALNSVQQSLRLNKRYPEALYNRALIIERLGLIRQAEESWRHYLDLGEAGEWGRIARAHLSNLSASSNSRGLVYKQLEAAYTVGEIRKLQEIARSHNQEAREYLEEHLLFDWARGASKSKLRHPQFAELAIIALGEALFAQTGDRLNYDLLEAFRKGASGQALDLKSGYMTFREGLRLYRNHKISLARSTLLTSEMYLKKANSPLHLWAKLYLAACDYQEKFYSAALLKSSEVITDAQAHGYHSLLGRSEWLQGLIFLEQGDAFGAITSFRTSLQQFEAVRELGNQASVESLLANSYGYIGDSQASWKFRHQSLLNAVKAGSERLPILYGETARALAKESEYDAAFLFQNEALSIQRATKDPLSIAEALWWRSMIFQRSGKIDAAIQDLREARRYAAEIDNTSIRDRTLAGISLVEGAALYHADPRRSIQILSEALLVYEKARYGYLRVELFLTRGRAFLAAGDDVQAEADWEQGIQTYENQRDLIPNESLQSLFFAQSENIFTEMIDLQYAKRRRVDRAFEYSERSRSRRLLEMLGKESRAKCVSGGEGMLCFSASDYDGRYISSLIPSEAAIIEFSVREHETLIFVARRGRIYATEVGAGHSDFRQLCAERFTEATNDRALHKGYRLLISPIESWLAGVRLLVFAPDEGCSGFPFAALKSPRDSQYLIQKYEVIEAPSAMAYLKMRRLALALSNRGKVASILAIGNPAFDRKIFPSLMPLPGAEAEVREASKRYPQSVLMVGQSATKEAILSRLGNYDVVQFSGHAVMDVNEPSQSKLLLTPANRGDSGSVSAVEIEKVNLYKPRVVILSACSTAVGKRVALEGALNFPRSFLVAGVPTVISTLWDVEDRHALEFFNLFHDAYSQGKSVAQAVRNAQVALLGRSDEFSEPKVWAAFQVFGANI